MEDFWHWGKIARYDLAAAMGKKILTATEPPLEILKTFEAVAADKQDVLDQWMLRWQSLDTPKGSPALAMKETTNQLMQLLDKGRYERRKDAKYIEENIARLNVNERAYLNGVQRLRESGELAVPYMISSACRIRPSAAARCDSPSPD